VQGFRCDDIARTQMPASACRPTCSMPGLGISNALYVSSVRDCTPAHGWNLEPNINET